MCINEAGLIKGQHYLGVGLNGKDEIYIQSITSCHHPDHHRIVHKAFTLCGLMTKTFDEWMATEVTREDLPR